MPKTTFFSDEQIASINLLAQTETSKKLTGLPKASHSKLIKALLAHLCEKHGIAWGKK